MKVVLFFLWGGPPPRKGDRPVIRGAYANPSTFWEQGHTFEQNGINALFVHSGTITHELIDRAREQGAPVYAEFGTFRGDYLLPKYPDIAPIGRDGLPIPRTRRFLGACPSHPELLTEKRAALRRLVREYPVQGVWLDYLQFHCDFELPDPPLDQSCFCDRCLARFQAETGQTVSGRTTSARAAHILENLIDDWTDWKCGVMVHFAAEARQIIAEERPGTLVGIYSCPWTDEEYGGALRSIVAEDLDRLHGVFDVFSPMVYHVKCGRPPGWVEEYSRWLSGRMAGLNSRTGRSVQVWPIVEAEGATGPELEQVLTGALGAGAAGVMFYALPHVAQDSGKLEAVRRAYLR